MKIKTTRDRAGLLPVLMVKNSEGPDPAYWVFEGITNHQWENMTVIVAGSFNGEFPKTFGHYHTAKVDETYKLVHGSGVLMLQKKHYEKGRWVPEIIDEIYLVEFEPEDEILITPEWGHAWANVGNTPLITFDNWRSGHSPDDYKPIEKLQGLAYYLVDEGGNITAKPNPNYKQTPEPKHITAKEFGTLH